MPPSAKKFEVGTRRAHLLGRGGEAGTDDIQTNSTERAVDQGQDYEQGQQQQGQQRWRGTRRPRTARARSRGMHGIIGVLERMEGYDKVRATYR